MYHYFFLILITHTINHSLGDKLTSCIQKWVEIAVRVMVFFVFNFRIKPWECPLIQTGVKV